MAHFHTISCVQQLGSIFYTFESKVPNIITAVAACGGAVG
jgi:hypothetical protein